MEFEREKTWMQFYCNQFTFDMNLTYVAHSIFKKMCRDPKRIIACTKADLIRLRACLFKIRKSYNRKIIPMISGRSTDEYFH